MQVGDTNVSKTDQSDTGQGLAEQLGGGRQNQYIVDETDRHNGEQTDEEELALTHLVKLKNEIGQHEAEAYIQAADIGYFPFMAHSLIGTNDQPFRLRDTNHDRHAYQPQRETNQTDQVTML